MSVGAELRRCASAAIRSTVSRHDPQPCPAGQAPDPPWLKAARISRSVVPKQQQTIMICD